MGDHWRQTGLVITQHTYEVYSYIRVYLLYMYMYMYMYEHVQYILQKLHELCVYAHTCSTCTF